MQAAGTGSQLVVYAAKSSPRLFYILDWIFKERLGIDVTVTTDIAAAQTAPFFISYGEPYSGACSIPDSGLLWATGIAQQNITTGDWQGPGVLYHKDIEGYDIPFDIFSATFFLISRYEEYYNYTPDKHDRYPPTESLLYRNGWLKRPVVDEWITAFGKLLSEKYRVTVIPPEFTFQPSYDIDIAFSYLHKGNRRSFGAFIRDILSANTSQLKERISVARGKKQDPYDSFDTLRQWHTAFGYTPFYFILASLQTTDFDKNISPANKHMQRIIRSLSEEGTVGMHPSYYSGKFAEYRQKEKETLEEITCKPISTSRQHYIKLHLPDTYHNLIQLGITDDHSMGYGSHLGFRAGTGSSFPWYDLQNEEQAPLRIYPFCFMDTTAMYEEKLNAEEAFTVLKGMRSILESTSSQLVTIFHNFSLGTAPEWNGWKEAYENFIKR
jgi:hypothetical protein